VAINAGVTVFVEKMFELQHNIKTL